MSSPDHVFSYRNCVVHALEGRLLFAADFRFSYSTPAISDIPVIADAVRVAAARWEAIILADLPDVPHGVWGAAVDDIRLIVDAYPIDGPGKILATAEPRYRRPNGGLPITGGISIDSDDAGNPRLVDIITHEIGHVLGIGSWTSLVSDYGGADPLYFGERALAEYRSISGNTTITGIPVENTGNPGTRDAHWREATFFNELMTGFYNSTTTNPLSRMSAAAMIDLGFPGVSLEGADAYNMPNGNPIPTMNGLTATTSSGAITLTATNLSDLGRASDGAGTGVAKVRFYRESNGIAGLQATGNVATPDQLVATVISSPWQASIDTAGLAAGTYTYYAQAVDVIGATSATARVDHVITLPPTPATPILDAASDHGLRNDDGITNAARPTLRGLVDGAPIGTVVDVFADGVIIGQADVTDGAWSFVPTTPLGDGTHLITAVSRVAGVAGAASSVLSIVIDTVAPHVAASRFEFLTRLGVGFDFDEDVSATLDVSDVDILNTTTCMHRVATLGSTSASSAFFALPPLELTRGDYTATLANTGVMDLAGNALATLASVSFFYLPGDVNRSRTVDIADLRILSLHYGQAGTALDGDLDYSGIVDFADLVLVAQNFGQVLTIPAPISVAAAKKPRVAMVVLR